MKRVISVLTLFIFGLCLSPKVGIAQDTTRHILPYDGPSTKFAVMVKDVLHFEAAILTASEMGVDKRHFKFEIVVVGSLAKSLVDDSVAKADISKCAALGAQIVVCEHAMEYFKVSRGQLDARIHTTPNAWVYMFELQDAGYRALVQ